MQASTTRRPHSSPWTSPTSADQFCGDIQGDACGDHERDEEQEGQGSFESMEYIVSGLLDEMRDSQACAVNPPVSQRTHPSSVLQNHSGSFPLPDVGGMLQDLSMQESWSDTDIGVDRRSNDLISMRSALSQNIVQCAENPLTNESFRTALLESGVFGNVSDDVNLSYYSQPFSDIVSNSVVMNARDHLHTAEIFKDQEEIQRYKIVVSQLQTIVERLLIERQLLWKKNGELSHLCLQLHTNNCSLQKENAAYKRLVSELYAFRPGAQRNLNEFSFGGGHFASSAFGTAFESLHVQAETNNCNTVCPDPSPCYQSPVAIQTSSASTPAQLQTIPPQHSSPNVSDKKICVQYTHSSPKQTVTTSPSKRSYSLRGKTLTAETDMKYTSGVETCFQNPTNPRTPTSVLAFPSPASKPDSGDLTGSCLRSISDDREALTDVYEMSKTTVAEQLLSSDRAAILTSPPVQRGTDTSDTRSSPCRESTALIANSVGKGVKSISIRLQEKPAPTSTGKSKSFPCMDNTSPVSSVDSQPISPISGEHRLDSSDAEVRFLNQQKNSLQENAMVDAHEELMGNGGCATKGSTGKHSSSREKSALEMSASVCNQGQYKTELCNNWQEKGSCPYAQHCRFAHGVAELRFVLRHPRYKTQPCRMIMEGKECIYSHRCHFRHSLTHDEMSLILDIEKSPS